MKIHVLLVPTEELGRCLFMSYLMDKRLIIKCVVYIVLVCVNNKCSKDKILKCIFKFSWIIFPIKELNVWLSWLYNSSIYWSNCIGNFANQILLFGGEGVCTCIFPLPVVVYNIEQKLSYEHKWSCVF